jgi:2-methylcitrate dehydratase
MANAHPLGAYPFKRENYVKKFMTLTEGIITTQESKRFLDLVQNLPELSGRDMLGLGLEVDKDFLKNHLRDDRGIF